nr:unnamed protein product [Digitaria exilis]
MGKGPPERDGELEEKLEEAMNRAPPLSGSCHRRLPFALVRPHPPLAAPLDAALASKSASSRAAAPPWERR